MSMSLGYMTTLLGALCAQAGTDTLKTRRAYVAGSYVVYVGGEAAAFVPAVSGGGVSAGVIVEGSGASGGYPKKHPGPVTYEDITFAAGAGVDRALAAWISETVNTARPIQKDGHFVSVDMNGNEHSRTTWSSGFLSEITFPALDGASKEPARIQVSITPRSTEFSMKGGGKAESGVAKTKAATKNAVAANFRLKIDGLDLSRVSRVEALSVRLKSVQPSAREAARRERTPAQVEVSNLVFVVDQSRAEEIYKWHDEFVVKGRNGDEHEKGGTLELLSANMQSTLFELTLKGIGILEVGPEESGNEATRRLRVEAYVESLALKIP